MAYNSLYNFVQLLESSGELIRVNTKVSTEFEIAEIADRVSKTEGGGKALLFENNSTSFPVLINALGSVKRICLALGVNKLDEIGAEMEGLLANLLKPGDNVWQKISMLPTLGKIASWMPKTKKGRGACQKVVHLNPDLDILPVLKCWPLDGGRFVTFPLVHTTDLKTGVRNVGMYRLQVFNKQLTGMHWHMHKTGARHYLQYKEAGLKMPVAVALGGDPVLTYAATAPLPDNIDEYMLAGFLRKKKVELVKCLTQDIYVPAEADIIIEGYVDPSEDLIYEGPFGDHTGFYSLADYYPKFHVTCITHKEQAIYPTTIVGIPPQEDAYIGKATERIFLTPIRLAMLPEIIDMDLPEPGVAHNLAIVSINKTFPGHAQKIMSAMWGAGQMMFNKILIVTPGKTNVHSYAEIANLLNGNFLPERDIHFSSGPLDVLDHASREFAFGGKMMLDFTHEGKTVFSEKKNAFDIPAFVENHVFIKNAHSLAGMGFPIAIFSIAPSNSTVLQKAGEDLLEICDVKIVVFIDAGYQVSDLYHVAWLATGNIDCSFDCKVISHNGKSCLIIDATSKSSDVHGFKREWPNVIVSKKQTIELVDSKWTDYNIGPFIPSPSLNFIR